MKHIGLILLLAIAGLFASGRSHAQEVRQNYGKDPFIQISKALPDCPAATGPIQTEKEWLQESHYRVERGNSCWIAGTCRLSNAYKYDAEIAETVQRRLAAISSLEWRQRTTLWLLIQRRFIMVQGCVAPDFNKKAFLAELASTADVAKVIDETITGSKAASVPYPFAPPNGAQGKSN